MRANCSSSDRTTFDGTPSRNRSGGVRVALYHPDVHRSPSEGKVTRLREAEPGDAAVCAAVHVRSWKATYRGMVPDEYLDALQPEDRLTAWQEWLAEPKERGCVLVVEVGSQIAGFGSFVAHDSLGLTWALLPALYLAPEAVGQGHGRALMSEGLARLVGYGYDHVELWVHPDNLRAQRFYEAGGWTTDGIRRTETVWGVELAELRYVRSLVG